MVATVLEPVGLPRADARNAASYQAGQIVTARKGSGAQAAALDHDIGFEL